MIKTGIDYGDRIWNPIMGCSTPCGVKHCWAETQCRRFAGKNPGYPKDFRVPEFFLRRLDMPARLKKPSWILTCFMGEFFDPCVRPEWQADVAAAIRRAPQHQYVILTKQPTILIDSAPAPHIWPHNVWFGYSMLRDGELPVVLELSRELVGRYGRRFILSVEPMLERMPRLCAALREGSFSGAGFAAIDWLYVGAETGAGARPPKPEWIVELVEAAQAAGIPTWVKDNAVPILRPVRPDLILQQRPEA